MNVLRILNVTKIPSLHLFLRKSCRPCFVGGFFGGVGVGFLGVLKGIFFNLCFLEIAKNSNNAKT